jgi:hypothetical protein
MKGAVHLITYGQTVEHAGPGADVISSSLQLIPADSCLAIGAKRARASIGGAVGAPMFPVSDMKRTGRFPFKTAL